MLCPNCGSTNVKWNSGTKNYSTVVDGRLQMHDVSPIFYLACEDCSETLKILSGDEVAEIINKKKLEIHFR